MLVISRKPMESFFIGDNIEVTVISIDRGQVRIAIEAPKDVPIMREELLPVRTEQQHELGREA